MTTRIIEIAKTMGRNDICDCGSGKKYKKCCMVVESTGTAKLSVEDTALFFRINMHLMGYVGKTKNKVMVLDAMDDMRGYQNYMADMRDICWEKPRNFIHKYLITNKDIGARERAIMEEWSQRYIKGDFFIVDFKPEYAVVMHAEKKGKKGILYGVKGLTDSLAHVVKRQKPIAVQMILLPFEGKIIYDGMLNYLNNDVLGEDSRNDLLDVYQEILKEDGIITEL